MNAKKTRTTTNSLNGEIGKFFLDMSKLVFGGIILASIMRADIRPAVLFVFGSISVLTLALVGFTFVKLSNNKK